MKRERLKSAAALIVVMITFLTACNKDGETLDPFLQQTPNELNFAWEGEEKGFAIMTNGGAWTISAPDADWITFDVTSGEGKGKRESVLASIPRNTGNTREAKIIVQAGGQRSEITVRQEDGRLALGEVSLEPTSFALGEQIEDGYLTFPYQKGIIGDELKFSVAVTGDGAGGISSVSDHSVILDALSGEISLPLSGIPTSVGEVVFTVTLTNYAHEITMPSPVSAAVLDLNQPHEDAADFVISGWLAQPGGTAANHEYIQFLALKDITFDNGANAYSVIVCNNAGQGGGVPPPQGWASGTSLNSSGNTVYRTYKFNITSGSVVKGQYFYVGGTAGKINGSTSAENSIPANKWVKQHAYNTQPGDDGVGPAVSNLLADSGLPYGVAAFRGTAVDIETEPMDVIFLRTPLANHAFYGDNKGFRVTNTDHYTVTGPNDRFFNQNGNNTFGLGGTADAAVGVNNFLELRGVYNVVTATWATPRSSNRILIPLTTSSTLSDIETATSTKMFPAP